MSSASGSINLTSDLVVVGLGPAGACAAAAAARTGVSVVAIDRKKTAGIPVQCAEFVPGPLYSEISNLSAATCQTIGTMTTMIDSKQPVQPHLSPDFYGAMIDRASFDQMLVSEAQQAGALILLDAKLAAFESNGLRLTNGYMLKPRVVIGADGPMSFTGRAIGQINEELVETRQITVALSEPSDSTDIFLCGAYRGGYAWLFPKGDRAHIGVGVVPSERKELKSLLDALHRKLIQEKNVGREILNVTGGAIPVGGMLQPYGKRHGLAVLLAGDAAGLTHPITGAGIAAAVLSGRMAGNAAAAFLNGDSDACVTYAQDLEELFGVALARAVARRRELLSASFFDVNVMRRSWIAFPEYWDQSTLSRTQVSKGYP